MMSLTMNILRYRVAGFINCTQCRCLSFYTVPLLAHNLKKEYFSWRYVKSSGPGGQNVNKSSTKVELRFKPDSAYWLSETDREKFLSYIAKRLNTKGELVISSDVHKSQFRNIENAMEKVHDLIEKATYEPPEPSLEQSKKVQKLMKAYNERRLQTKKRNSESKRERKKVDFD